MGNKSYKYIDGFRDMANSKSTEYVLSILKNTFKKENFKVLSGTTKSQKIKIESDDRDSVYTQVPKILKEYSLSYTKTDDGSVGSYDIKFDSFTVRLLFKNKSGGMSETTLNSTITELVPCILFIDKKTNLIKNKTTKKDFLKVIKYLKDNPNSKVYVGSDAKPGMEFIKEMSGSSKFVEKMINAKGILDYLVKLNGEQEITNLYWAYRGKPTGVVNNHKGDVFVKFKNGKMLGVSLKAGTGKSEEPKLNTYVNAVLENLNEIQEIKKLKKKVWKEIHSTFGLSENWTIAKDLPAIKKYREVTPQNILDEQYNKMLEICRASIVKVFNKDKNATLKFIKEQIIAEQKDVPLVVVKGLNTGMYKILNEEDELETFLPEVKTVSSYINPSSKQNWHIDLISKKSKLTLNMSIRTNKSKPHNKLAQGYNLAIKFNSLTKS